MNRLENLDGLRGFAALIVVAGHLCNQLNLLPHVMQSGGGQVGVQLFFCLSGFLMGWLYIPRPATRTALLNFYRRRIARVFPMFYAVVIVSWVAFYASGWPVLFAIDDSNFIRHILFIDGISLLWTVPVEVHFYLAFGLLWLVFSANKYVGTVLTMVLIPLLIFIPDPLGVRPYLMTFFLAGVLVSLLPTISSSLFFAVAVVLLFIAMPRASQSLGIGYFDFWKSPLNLAAVAALVWTSISSPLATVTLGSAPARYLGKISYSVYLLHWPVVANLTTFTNLPANPALYVLVVLGVTIALASITYSVIERPARQFITTGYRSTRSAAISAPTP